MDDIMEAINIACILISVIFLNAALLLIQIKNSKENKTKKLPSYTNQPANLNAFVEKNGSVEIRKTIKDWYNNSLVSIGAIVAQGKIGKTSLIWEWCKDLKTNKINPKGVFWWGFDGESNLEKFMEALICYLEEMSLTPLDNKISDLKRLILRNERGGDYESNYHRTIFGQTFRLQMLIQKGEYLIVLDGFEVMQNEDGKVKDKDFRCLLRALCAKEGKGLVLITSKHPINSLITWDHHGFEQIEWEE